MLKETPVVVEQSFPVSKQKLWNAITRHSQMTQWFFENIEAFEPKVGFKTTFTVENEGRIFPHLWTINHVEINKKIVYNWKYKGYPGDSEVSFELLEQGKNTLLKVTHKTLEDFPQNIPEFTSESCEAGWKYFIQQQLKNYITHLQT